MTVTHVKRGTSPIAPTTCKLYIGAATIDNLSAKPLELKIPYGSIITIGTWLYRTPAETFADCVAATG